MDKPTVLVTGGAKRVGEAIVRAFAAADWHVAIHFRSSDERAEELAKALPSAEAVQADFSDPGAPERLADELAGRLSDWRVLINCASVFEPDDVRGLDRQTFAAAMRVNALAPTLLAQGFLARARSPAGRRVIQITDQKLANINPDFFSYTMSKAALDATIRMLAMGASRAGDRIYGLAPGAILPSHDQSAAEAETSHRLNLLQRRTRADEVAQAALFLATGPLASGETLYLDSGQHLLDQPRDVIYLARGEGEMRP